MKLAQRATQVNYKIKWLISFTLALFLMWALCIHWTGVHQIAIKRNIISGSLEIDSVAGINFTSPWVQVARIDTRPRRLCVDCSCRALSCKLIQFNPSYWKDFVDNEGFKYYWLSNRISFNLGADQEYRGVDWILRGYGFDSKQHNFIKNQHEQ